MITISRPADEPYRRIDAEADQMSAKAENVLLRRLLQRCECILKDVALEARISGEADRMVEILIRDIELSIRSNA